MSGNLVMNPIATLLTPPEGPDTTREVPMLDFADGVLMKRLSIAMGSE